ncbi:type I-E CRISPR-associated protein Cas6/Cse3/CasE [Methylolobus aquaticus]|nr:type I-E CRISPR-associated protein Cas6/Cse3/CasE [Methylolobus aquaticus]
MYLSKLTLDPRHPLARRDLANAYDMHRSLSRAFVADENARPSGFLWRLERSADCQPASVVLVQSVQPGNWTVLDSLGGYAFAIHGNKSVALEGLIQSGARYRFRLLANPTVTRAGKRYGLLREEDQLQWLNRQGARHGFEVRGCIRGASERLDVRQGSKGHRMTFDTALFEGILSVQSAETFRDAMLRGLGHGKALGLGLLSVARVG